MGEAQAEEAGGGRSRVRGASVGFGSGPKVRRGDVRASVLMLLAEEPRYGYQIIQEIEERSGGLWRPSAGSVYPGLRQLQEEGLVQPVRTGGRKLFELTEEGRGQARQHAEGGAAPWDVVFDSVGEQGLALRELTRELATAAMQVVHAGSASQIAEARRTLTEARRSLYRLLAEDEPNGND